MMKLLDFFTILIILASVIFGKPVDRRGPPQPAVQEAGSPNAEGTGLEYDRYLQEVFRELETDDNFRKKLESINISDIKSGRLATHLDLVNRKVRTQLDELKRREIGRIQRLHLMQQRMTNERKMKGIERFQMPHHIDVGNPETFEVKDLEKLIMQATQDLERVETQQQKEFKSYEMEKEYQHRENLKKLNEEERVKEEQRYKDVKTKHKVHDDMKHPGSKNQFEDVWDNRDNLANQDFDPKTFFIIHDLNNDMMWSMEEVEAVLQRELSKVYDEKNSPEEDDPVERFEEMRRMRVHVRNEVDTNNDTMISLEEFLAYTGQLGNNEKFNEDDGWNVGLTWIT